MPPELPTIGLAIASVVAAGFDLGKRRIPNWLNLVIFFGGVGFLLTLPDMAAALFHFAHFAIALIAGMVLFAFRMWGGGDAKFYAASAIWFPLGQAPMLAAVTALSGLALVIVYFGLGRLRRGPDRLRELPYGVAIACGVIGTLGFNSLSAAAV